MRLVDWIENNLDELFKSYKMNQKRLVRKKKTPKNASMEQIDAPEDQKN